MDRLLRNAGGVVQLSLYDSSGELANPGGGAVTAAVTDSAGDPIAGSPFAVANPPDDTGILKFSLPATLDALGVYDVAWTLPDSSKRYTVLEVVGSFLFSVADLRAQEPKLTDASAYPAAALQALRSAIEERFEQVAGVSFTRRGRRARLNGRGLATTMLPDRLVTRIVSASIDDEALDVDDLVLEQEIGRLEGGTFSAGTQNVEVVYEHGWWPTPGPVARAGLEFAVEELLASPLEGGRATAVFTELGGYRLSIAGRDGSTGLPAVDAVLQQYGRKNAGGFA